MKKSDAYKRVIFRGKVFNKRTAAALMEMERRLGYPLTVLQGSYNTSVSASSGTHAAGGAVDLAPYDAARKVKVGRKVGFAMWHRQAIPGVWPEHAHGGLVGDREAAPELAAQFVSYRSGRNGLADNARDTEWRPKRIPTFHYWLWRKKHKALADKLDKLPAA